MAYFSNGSEGGYLDAQCGSCPIGDKMCPVHLVQLAHNYDQVGNDNLRDAMNLLVDKHGNCQLRPLVVLPAPVVADPLEWLDK